MARALESLIEDYRAFHQRPDRDAQLISTRDGLLRLRRDPSRQPDISIVIPAHNEEACLLGTLWSVSRCNPPRERVEVVVVENCSTDQTASLAEKAGARVVCCATKGAGPARQRGLVEALGNLIITTDADTFVPPDWIKIYTAFFENHPEIMGVYGRVSHVDEKGPNLSLELYEMASELALRIRDLISPNKPIVSGQNFAFRREAILARAGYDSSLQRGEDIHLARVLVAEGLLRLISDPDIVVCSSARRHLDQGLPAYALGASKRNAHDLLTGRGFAGSYYKDVRPTPTPPTLQEEKSA